jgi:AhpD family alkylhydroperoxidase
MARLQPRTPRGLDLIRRLTNRTAKRIYGDALEPTTIAAHNRSSMLAVGMFAYFQEQGAKTLDHRYKSLAMLRTAQLVGCEWCLDFGSRLAQDGGIPDADLRELSYWRESARFGELDRIVLEYAEGMTRTPVVVSDELFTRLRSHLDEAQIVELTTAIAGENLYSRSNWALGIEGQGFTEGMYCVLPDRSPAQVLVGDAVAR